MSYLPSQQSRNLVQRIIDDIKRRADEHAKRHARAKLLVSEPPALAPARRLGAACRAPPASWREKRNQHILQHGSIQRDYFTRLVDSSPKPRVLRSVHHPVATHLLKLTNSASYRKYRRLTLLTSAKLIREYCDRHGACSRIYTTSHENPLLLEPKIRAEKVILCSKKLIQKVSDLHSYKGGLVAEVPYPQPSTHLGNAVLVLCVASNGRREDNGRVASLMRTAQALQWQAIWLLKHGANDFLDPLSIRASQNCLDTMPYISGDAREAISFAAEKRLLLCICTDGGDSLHSKKVQLALKEHHGMMLLVGRQPKELVDVAIKISVPTISKRGIGSGQTRASTELQHYKLDNFTTSCILMYLVRKHLHPEVPRSPFVFRRQYPVPSPAVAGPDEFSGDL